MQTKDNSKRGEYAAVGSLLHAPRVGRLAASPHPGEVLVECDGAGPRRARLLAGLDRISLSHSESLGREVLLVFDGGDPEKPVIVGLLEDPLETLISFKSSEERKEERNELLIDGKSVVIEAEEEIILRCGEGSITLRRDGKVVVRGTNLLSRSSGPNRIKGGSVSIN